MLKSSDPLKYHKVSPRALNKTPRLSVLLKRARGLVSLNDKPIISRASPLLGLIKCPCSNKAARLLRNKSSNVPPSKYMQTTPLSLKMRYRVRAAAANRRRSSVFLLAALRGRRAALLSDAAVADALPVRRTPSWTVHAAAVVAQSAAAASPPQRPPRASAGPAMGVGAANAVTAALA